MKRLIFFGFSIALLFIVIWFSNPHELAQKLLQANLLFIFIAFIFTTTSLGLRVLKWKVLLTNVGFSSLFPVQTIGLTASNMTPGKIAEPAKSIILKMKEKIDVSESLPTVIWERVLDVLVLLIFSVLSFSFLTSNQTFVTLGMLSIGGFSILIIIMVVVVSNKNIGMKIFGFLKHFPITNKISDDFITNFYNKKIRRQKIVASFFITVVVWIVDGLALYLCLMALGVIISPIVPIGILSIATLIGVASTLPGGLGSSDAVMVVTLGVWGVATPVGAAAVILLRFVSLWYTFLLGGVSFVYLSRKIDLKGILFK